MCPGGVPADKCISQEGRGLKSSNFSHFGNSLPFKTSLMVFRARKVVGAFEKEIVRGRCDKILKLQKDRTGIHTKSRSQQTLCELRVQPISPGIKRKVR